MITLPHWFCPMLQLVETLLPLLVDALRYLSVCPRPATTLAAENLVLRKQPALYQERHIKPRRATKAARLILVWLGRWFDWRWALVIVQPDTFTRWHRESFRIFWRGKSTAGRPPIPADLQTLIRRMAHDNPTWGAERTAKWTMQQLHEAIPADHPYHFLIHDRDSIFFQQLDQHIRNLGLRGLKTPPQSPQANVLCERLIGTLRRECLDLLIPLSAHHLGCVLQQWVLHYNAGRPHMALGPGIPQPPLALPVSPPSDVCVVTRSLLGGLHHEYGFAEQAA
jgi:hypothetical protein